jgi:hypothetical protein
VISHLGYERKMKISLETEIGAKSIALGGYSFAANRSKKYIMDETKITKSAQPERIGAGETAYTSQWMLSKCWIDITAPSVGTQGLALSDEPTTFYWDDWQATHGTLDMAYASTMVPSLHAS